MTLRAAPSLLAVLALCAPAVPAAGQAVVVYGRVEDAEWRRPLAGVRVLAADTTVAAVTDSLGEFALLMPRQGSFIVRAERLGYRSDTFDLGADAPSRISVLRLEPEAIELEGVTAVGEAAVTRVLADLRRRRNAYPGSVAAFDRSQLERAAPSGSVWDFVRPRTFQVYECGSALSGLCARVRGLWSFRAGFREVPVRVCVDGRESWGAVAELNGLHVRDVSLIEIFRQGAGGIRVYTPRYLVASARGGHGVAMPLEFGC